MADGSLAQRENKHDVCCNEPVIVGITGGSGAGKSTFAERLRERLGHNAVVIAHDEYYWNLPDIPLNPQTGRPDFDTPDALDTRLLIENLRALKSGQAATLPHFEFRTHMRAPEGRRVEPAPVILLEGLFITCDRELLELLDLTIFMDEDDDIRALRRIVRDCKTRGIGVEAAANMYYNPVKPAFERYVEPFRRKADLVICDALNERSLECVAQAIMALVGK